VAALFQGRLDTRFFRIRAQSNAKPAIPSIKSEKTFKGDSTVACEDGTMKTSTKAKARTNVRAFGKQGGDRDAPNF